MTVAVNVDPSGAEEIVGGLTSALLRSLSNLVPLWRTVGVKVREHIAERWITRYSSLAPLHPTTIKAKERRWGYYARTPGRADYLRRGGAFGFWWTGKALGRALGPDAFRVTAAELIYDFGIRNQPRQRLEWMHFGGKGRAPRPIYDIAEVQAIADHWARDFVDALTQSLSGFKGVLRRPA